MDNKSFNDAKSCNSRETPISSNFNMKLDFDESHISVEKLKNSNCQNYINLLNDPNPQYSLYDDITSKFSMDYIYSYTNYYGQYEAESDLEKFGGSLGSPKSQGSTKDGSSKSNRLKLRTEAEPQQITGNKLPQKTIKELVSENYDNYLQKLGRKYKSYKHNHFSQSPNMSIISNINPYDNSYKSIDFNKSLFQVIPEEYFSPNYKIKSYMLNKSFDDLLDFSEDLTEKCGVVESHLSKVLEKSQMLFNYINNNLSLEQTFNTYIERVNHLKNVRNFMKKNYLNNAAITIKAGIKKRNIKNTISLIKELDFVQKSSKLIKTLLNVPSKYQTVLDLQSKSNKILLNLSSQKNKLKMIKNLEDEFREFAKKITENTNKQVSIMMLESMRKIITYNELELIKSADVGTGEGADLGTDVGADDGRGEGLSNQIEELNTYTEQYFINLTDIQTTITLSILRAIKKSDSSTIIQLHKQIIETALVVFKTDNDFYSKLRNIFLKNFIQVMSETQEKINNLFRKALEVDPKKTENINFLKTMELNNQQLYSLVLTKCFHDIYKDLKELGSEILTAYKNFIYSSSINLDKKKADILAQTFSDEVLEINKILLNELFEIVKSQNQKILKCIDNSEYNYTTINIIKNFFPNEVLFEGIFKKNQETYLSQLFETQNKRINQSLEFETWESVIIPEKFKKIVKFILNTDFKTLKSGKVNQILDEFKIIEVYEDNSSSKSNSSMSLDKEVMSMINMKKTQSTANVYNKDSVLLKIDDKDIKERKDLGKDVGKDGKELTKLNKIDSLEDNKSINDYLISIDESRFKLIISMFEVITLIFKTFKMLCLFDNNLHEQILNKLSKVIRNTCSMSNEMIINQKAVSNKSIKSVTNEEVTHMVSSYSFLKKFIQCKIKIFSNILTQDNIIINVSKYMQEAISDIDKLIFNGKQFLFKIAYEFSIKESLTLLAKIDFAKYPIIEDGVNIYVKKLKPIVSVYEKMANCFELNDLKETTELILNSLIENISKQIGNTKIEIDNQLKQFKKDMKFLKNKVLKAIVKIDTTDYINRIDLLIKGVTSVKISFNKKNQDD